MLREKERTVLLLHEGMPAVDRLRTIAALAEPEAHDGILVLGTASFIGEGFDDPALDTL